MPFRRSGSFSWIARSALGAAIVLVSTGAHAATIAAFNFGTDRGGAATATAVTVDPAVTASVLSRGADFPADNVYAGPSSGQAGSFNTNSGSDPTETLTEALSDGRYAQFTVTPNTGSQLNLDSLNVNAYSQNQARTLGLAYSVGGGAFTIADVTATIPNNFDGQPLSLALSGIAALQGVSDPVTLRLLIAEPVSAFEQRGFGNASGDGNDIVLNGTVVVPEPASLALLGIGGVLVAARSRRA